jgi:predicted HTH domain antitoxin
MGSDPRAMSITLEVDDAVLQQLPLGPGERERHMTIELAARYYARGWLSYGRAAAMAGLDHYAFACQLAERDIPRNYGLNEALEDIADARRQ